MRAGGALLSILLVVAITVIGVAIDEESPALYAAPSYVRGLGETAPAAAPAAAPVATPPLFSESKLLAGLVRTDSGHGSASVGAIWLTPEYLLLEPQAALSFDPLRNLLFQVAVCPSPPGMSVGDLRWMIYLRDGSGKEYGAPAWTSTEDGPRLAGLAAFPTKDSRGNPVPASGSKSMEIVIRDLAGVKERVFRWDLAER